MGTKLLLNMYIIPVINFRPQKINCVVSLQFILLELQNKLWDLMDLSACVQYLVL